MTGASVTHRTSTGAVYISRIPVEEQHIARFDIVGCSVNIKVSTGTEYIVIIIVNLFIHKMYHQIAYVNKLEGTGHARLSENSYSSSE